VKATKLAAARAAITTSGRRGSGPGCGRSRARRGPGRRGQGRRREAETDEHGPQPFPVGVVSDRNALREGVVPEAG